MKKIFGTTLFLHKKKIDFEYGTFDVYIFQDTITKLHVICIVCLSDNWCQSDEPIHIRMHSSCITSEMIGSIDCDCVQQLNQSIKYFSEKSGILFYLVQEGRGCGYIGKSRACQMVQFNEVEQDCSLTTFEAYRRLGMKSDYRSYHNIKEILILLELSNKSFVMLTNNPDKINGLSSLGINIVDNVSIEFKPNPYNKSYLVSKEAYGHNLSMTKENQDVNPYYVPFRAMHPFPIHSFLKENYLHISSYFLPIMIERNVCWFQMNLFYDTCLNHEFIFLHNPSASHFSSNVYIHSENIIERLPLRNNNNVISYKSKLQDIFRNGGTLVLISKYNFGIPKTCYLYNNMHVKVIDKVIKKSALCLSEYFSTTPISILNRINDLLCIDYRNVHDWCLPVNAETSNVFLNKPYVTGIGSSRYHAMYLASLINSTYIDFESVNNYSNNIIVVSQGVNPTVFDYIKKQQIHMLIHGNHVSSEKTCHVSCCMNFISDNPDNTLARFTGILTCLIQMKYAVTNIYPYIQPFDYNRINIPAPITGKNYYFIFMNQESYIGIIANMLKELYACNICFIGNYIEFVHGTFQVSLVNKDTSQYFVFGQHINTPNMEKMFKKECIENVLWFTSGDIIEWIKSFMYETFFHPITVNQINWNGKESQSIIYNHACV